MVVMPTLSDVASQARVSIATVSHVLNGTRPVREETRLRVERAVEEVGYRRDRLARALRRNRTDTVGLVVSDPAQPVFAQMIHGVELEAQTAGYTVMLAMSSDDAAQELEAIVKLKEHRVDGIILSESSHMLDRFDEILRGDEIPLVLLDRLASRTLDQVGAETVAPMKALVDHLIANGCTDIGMIAGDLAVPTLKERFEGYRLALESAGLPVREDRIITGVRTERETWAAMRPVLQGATRAEAYVTASTNLTAGFLRAMRDVGVQAPDDVKLVSFDELPYADFFAPRITSVVQPAVEMGRLAMRLLLRRLNAPDSRPQTTRLRPWIAHRETCGCPPGTPSPFPEFAG